MNRKSTGFKKSNRQEPIAEKNLSLSVAHKLKKCTERHKINNHDESPNNPENRAIKKTKIGP
jgi:hypothetical protein